MPQFGTIKRLKPRVEVFRGFNPQDPSTRSATAPVSSKKADGSTNDPALNGGFLIRSGQVVSLIPDGGIYKWALGFDPTATPPQVPHIAYNDSTDEDVIEAGNMPGLSCAGQFEIATAFFKAADVNLFDMGVLLTPDGLTGNVKVGTKADTVIGYVTRALLTVDGPGAYNSVPSYPNSNVALTDRAMVSFATLFDRPDTVV